ncbi:mRNA-decapping enzyme subunit 2 [Diplodia seriata]|uniref:Iron-sulfur cluster assembly factor IBA57 homolog, mitochondrial n=1 Tax=Diplodia seriata TaxID=420778 RepID=A0ABR3CRF0_9PEZI
MPSDTGLDDLCVRFIINLPKEELESVERICFQVEEAHWFYEDFIRPLDPSLPSMSLKQFCLLIFQHCPLFSEYAESYYSAAYSEFLAYKTRVPVRGAILLNDAMDHVVLVKGWKKGARWSFPRGKINKDEDDLDCAVREVYEETGFDAQEAGLIKDHSQMKYIEVSMREQHMRLYVFRGVPMDTYFEPRTRKEISKKISWYKISELPTLKKRQNQGQGAGENLYKENMFYMVAPFLGPLKGWIKQQNKLARRTQPTQAIVEPVDEEETAADESAAEGTTQHRVSPDTHLESLIAGLRQSKAEPDTTNLPEVTTAPDPSPDAASALKRMLSPALRPFTAASEIYSSNRPHHQQSSGPIPEVSQNDRASEMASGVNYMDGQPPPVAFANKPRTAQADALLGLFRKPSASGPVSPPQEMPAQSLVPEPAELSAQSPSIDRQQLVHPGSQSGYMSAGSPVPPVGTNNNKAGETSATVSGPFNAPDFDQLRKHTRVSQSNGRASPRTQGRPASRPERQATPQFSILSRPRPEATATPSPKLTPSAPVQRRDTSSPRNILEAPKPFAPHFTPQILRRPQNTMSPNSSRLHSFDRRESASSDQKSALLSLFSKPQTQSPKGFPSGVISPVSPLPERQQGSGGRSRISSITSAPGEGLGSRSARGSVSGQPTTPVDKSFLLGYLNGVVKDAGNGITPLPHRRLLALSGPDAPKFLQGLTTNNVLVDRRDDAAGWYTAFLNAQGRVLYDALVYATPHAAGAAAGGNPGDGSGDGWACFIEVDGSCVNELHRLLRRHKLRSRIKLRVVDEGEWGVWAAWMADGSPDALPSSPDNTLKERRVVHLPDTRVPGFGGHRLLVPGGSPSSSVDEFLPPSFAALERATPRDYQIRRYLHGLAEGPAEMRAEEALPLESNVDLMRGVDFRKGCYIGQELTIRTKHTGVVRKRILPVRLYDLDGEEPERLEFVEGGVGGGVKGEDVPPGVADVKKIAEGGAPQADAEQGAAAAPPPARRRKDGRSAGKWLAGVGNVGLALCRLEMMTDVKVAAEGMGPASGGYQPGMKFGLKWTVPGEEGEKGVGVKAFVPEWHRLRVEEEAKSKKKKIVQREFELDDE